ncbi:hypothetical protein B5X24_HaOG207694 [Helicoverpa armigera]|uniref:Uncharacterized protein n=1 Tax=Helicoverpa armigera TaxID=29058 RepID=A0A2W1BMM5_HELAM|nr:hypothetical protein B5X24_HaOG207694 [Helicoverpa armigera]
MASPPPNPKEGEEGGSEFKEEPSGERPTAPQKTFIAPPASQLPTKLQYVTLGASGPSGIKQFEPPPEASAFEETYTEYPLEGTDFSMWKPDSPKESTSEAGPTRVPSTDIIVEMPPELDIKVEPIDIKLEESMEIKLEEPVSPGCTLLPVEYPMMFMVAPPYTQTPSDLPFLSTTELPDAMEAHLLHPGNVESLLMDPGEGPSGLSSQMLGLLEESEPTFTGEEGRVQQRLPAFTQAFQTAQSPKPPPPPPPPH